MVDRFNLKTRLSQAIERKEFSLFYQSQIDLRSREILGFEALLRWNHPEQGLLTPSKFMSLLEETELAIQVGHWAFNEAYTQAALWNRRNCLPLKVAVNLSARQLNYSDIVDIIDRAIEAAGLDRALAALEVTEDISMTNFQRSQDVLSRLQAAGISIFLDDFGKGYSSLNYLLQFPVDIVKIDPSFIHELPGNPKAASLVRAIIAMTHALGKKVLAEGIESSDQEAFLIKEECDYGQGFLYDKPAPGREIEASLENRAFGKRYGETDAAIRP